MAEILRMDPPQVRDLDELGLTFDDGAVEKMKTNRFRRVVMFDGEEFIVDADLHSKLFHDLALERGLQGFAGFHLSTRKLPQAGQVNMIEPLCDEDLPAAADDRRNHIDDHNTLSRPVPQVFFSAGERLAMNFGSVIKA